MKRLFHLILFLFATNIYAQTQNESTTDSFLITGKVKNEKTISLSDLKKYPTIELKDINTSCSPKKEDKTKLIKAVLLKNILDSVAFQYERARMLNHYYFLFVASDGYKMVFSFNEIYNTEVGNHLYVATELNGTEIKDSEKRILILSTKDLKSGGRNMKWLSKIVVCSAE